MKKFLVTLNFHTRHAQPNIGDFIYTDKYRRHVWKGKETTDPSELAQSVNEALQFQRTMDFMELVVEVLTVEAPEAAAPQERPQEDRQDAQDAQEPVLDQEAIEEPANPFIESQKKKSGKPRQIFTLKPATQ